MLALDQLQMSPIHLTKSALFPTPDIPTFVADVS
jgi:hypothetical protein